MPWRKLPIWESLQSLNVLMLSCQDPPTSIRNVLPSLAQKGLESFDSLTMLTYRVCYCPSPPKHRFEITKHRYLKTVREHRLRKWNRRRATEARSFQSYFIEAKSPLTRLTALLFAFCARAARAHSKIAAPSTCAYRKLRTARRRNCAHRKGFLIFGDLLIN
jgi:hypothetical protein